MGRNHAAMARPEAMAPTRGARFLCVGAAHWDIIATTAAPLDAGADVPGRVVMRPGGVAQNIARALAALGASVRLLAAVGPDMAGVALEAALSRAGVETAWLCRRMETTDRYVAIEAADGALHAAVADCASLERVGPALLAPLATTGWTGPVVADGNLPPELLSRLLALAPTLAFVGASPAKTARHAAALLAAQPRLYLNRAEAEALCGTDFADAPAAVLGLRARGAVAAVVTDGPAAAAACRGDVVVARTPPAVIARSVTGAGDAFVARHLAATVAGVDLEDALTAALDAAARHITVAPS